MKSRGSRPPGSSRRPKKGVARLFVLGAVFAAAHAAVPGRALAGQAVTAPVQPADGAVLALRYEFAIAPGSLGAVAVGFERATGLRLVFADAALATISSPGVSGKLSLADALDQLLAGTSVAARIAGATITLDVERVVERVTVVGDSAARSSSPKYTQPLRDTPQTVAVIPHEVLEAQGATSLRDALRNTPGITLTAGEGGTAPGDNLLIRGFSARNDVFVDGVRDSGVVSRDTFNVESVEVAKGPSSVVSGRGSTGGSVNLVTKVPQLLDAAAVRVTAGSADQRRVSIDLNRRTGEAVSFRMNAMWQDSGVARRDAVALRSWGFAPAIGLGVGRPTTLTLGYQRLQQHNVPDYGLPGTLPAAAVEAGTTIDALDFSNFYGLRSRDHEKTTSESVTGVVEHRFSSTRTLRSLTRYGRNDLDRVVTAPRAATASNGAFDPGYEPAIAQIRRTDAKYQYRNDRTLTNQTDLSSSFATGRIRHDLVLGAEVAHERQPSHSATDLYSAGRPPVADLFHPDPDQPYLGSIVPTGATSDGRSRSAAVYAFDTVKLGERLQADLGLRWDRVDVEYRTMAVDGSRSDLERVDRAASGRAGLVFKPAVAASIYGVYSSSFNPAFDGSFGLTLADAGNNSASLPPERTHHAEIGAKWEAAPNLLATVALFRTDKTNAKTTDAATGATVLAGDQRVDGLEVGLAGRLTTRWELVAGLSLLDGSIRESLVTAEVDKRLSYVPEMSFNTWSSYRLGRFELGGGAQFTGGYYFNNANVLSSENAAAIQRLTRYWLFSGLAAVEVNDRVRVQINGANLGNARYVDRGYNGHFIPGAGRSLSVTPVVTF